MPKPLITALATCLAGAAPALAHSDTVDTFETGNDLLDACGDRLGRGFCFGYVAGIADDVEVAKSLHAPGSQPFYKGFVCIPPRVRVSQLVDIVVTYLRTHTEQRHYTAASLIPLALDAAAPCQ